MANIPGRAAFIVANDDNQSAAETARLNRYEAAYATSTNTSTNTNTNVDLPGKRLKNPLSEFASYTYQLTLYMITPDAYNVFVQSGRQNINAIQNPSGLNSLAEVGANTNQLKTTGGAFIVAQSGGVNTETANRRAPGMNLDYYIDDLKITQALSGPATASAINITNMSFTISEPYGFSFNTQLLRAFETIKKNSKIKDYQDSGNQYRQDFILGIKFQGYTLDGTPATPDKFFSSDTFNPSESATGVFERFFDIKITSIKFRIDGSMTKYAIEAVTKRPNVAFGLQYGVVDNITPITAATAGEALQSLTASLNKNQQGRSVNIEYAIEYLGDAKFIKNASMINPGDTDKGKQANGAAPNNSNDVNAKTAKEAINDSSKRILQVDQGTPVVQAIGQIIKQSSYLRDALTMLYTTNETPDENTASPKVIVNKNPREIKWYNLGARVETLAWDKTVGDFSYKITYIIQPFNTPGTYTPYGKTSKYYGPHKRYNYWFTGKNSEVLEYTQTLDALYFNIVQTPSVDPNSPSYLPAGDVPSATNKRNNYERNNGLNDSQEAENQYLTSLFSPAEWVEAKIKILGDPDFLMNDSPGSLNEVYREYYSNDGFTINPNSGQVFVEINFNEATDYDNNTGLLKINESLLFWSQPNTPILKSNIKGVAYRVLLVESTFSGGSFTQRLTLNLNPAPYTQTETTTNAARENTNTPVGDNRTGSSQGDTAKTTPSSNGTVSQSTGFMYDTAGIDAQVKRIALEAKNKPNTNPPRTIPTIRGPVLDGESDFSGTTFAGVAALPPQLGSAFVREVPSIAPGGKISINPRNTR
jgi:hypothetical protein